MQCRTCGEWIRLGNVDTGEGALVNHEGRRWCIATVERNKQLWEMEAAEVIWSDMVHTELNYLPYQYILSFLSMQQVSSLHPAQFQHNG